MNDLFFLRIKLAGDSVIEGAAIATHHYLANVGDTLFSLSPNPSNGDFEIDLSLNQQYSGTATCEILDPTERVVSVDRAIIENGWMHLSKSLTLPSGFYLVRTNIEGNIYQAKVLIQKN
jgi:hypothetical protein